jgi:hypothetical protein
LAHQITGDVVITPAGTDFIFTPESVMLNNGTPSADIECVPTSFGLRNITFTNDRGFPNPSAIAFRGLVQSGKIVNRSTYDRPFEFRNEFLFGPDHGDHLPYGPYDPAVPMSIINKDVRGDPLDPLSDAIFANFRNDGITQLGFDIGYISGKGQPDEWFYAYGGVYSVVRGNQPRVPVRCWVGGTIQNPGDYEVSGTAAGLLTITLLATISGSVIITPHAPTGGFSPSSVTVSNASPTAQIQRTGGGVTCTDEIQFTNNRGLHDIYPNQWLEESPMDPMGGASAYLGIPVDHWPFDPNQLSAIDQILTVVSPDESGYGGRMYELFHGWTDTGGASWRAAACVMFDFGTGLPLVDGTPSASGSGMPIWPILLRWDEYERARLRDPVDGYIPHALYITAHLAGAKPVSIWPGRHAAGGDPNFDSYNNPNNPRMGWGGRFKIKDSWYQNNIGNYNSYTRVIVNTLWRYGAFMLDGGRGFALQCTSDYRWSEPDMLWHFNSHPLPPEAFEMLEQPYGCTISGPSTVPAGTPVTYTLTRDPRNQLSRNGISLYSDLYTGSQIWRGACDLTDATPINTITFMPNWTGAKTLGLYQSTCYWLLPGPFTLTVT